jgi:MYXO-CTERM domain-containing protein
MTTRTSVTLTLLGLTLLFDLPASRASAQATAGSMLAAVAVISDDLAKTTSVLSNISCLQVVETNGFWEKYKASGGDAEQGCVCSTPGAGHRGTSNAQWPWLAGLLGVVGFLRTRRRR